MSKPILERILENSALAKHHQEQARHYAELVETDAKTIKETMGSLFGSVDTALIDPAHIFVNKKVTNGVEDSSTDSKRGLNEKMLEALNALDAHSHDVDIFQIKNYFKSNLSWELIDKQIKNSFWYLGKKKGLIEFSNGRVRLK